MATGEAKVIDNAIMGFMQQRQRWYRSGDHKWIAWQT